MTDGMIFSVKAFLPVIMSDLGIRKINGICVKENIASCKVLEKAGFTLVYEGIGCYQGEEREIHKYVFGKKNELE